MAEKLLLSDLQLIIRDSLYLSLPEFYWVIAEISELKENNAGHCYLELIEKHPEETNTRARIKAIVWSKRYRFIKSFFENITGETLKEGQKILVKAKVEYHELYGLSLIISDIDPAFTMGELAIKRQIIIQRLEKEGVFTMNKELELPLIPQRIAVISSKNAAGYSDFINHLAGNSFGYSFSTHLIDSTMQGADSEKSIIKALDTIAENYDLFDVVVIIRGGGSQSDLSWFDNYNIAYHITQFPIPVITGIGHEKDTSVTDMVANMSLKTPTAVADFLIDCMIRAENQLMEMSSEIKHTALEIISDNKARLEACGIKIAPLAKIMLSENRDMLSEKIIKIINTGKEYNYRAIQITSGLGSRLNSTIKYLTSEKHRVLERARDNLVYGTTSLIKNKSIKVDGFATNLSILNPSNVLSRGYTITSINGKIMKKGSQLKPEDVIDTRFSDKTVKSKVLE
jgi:exodeoxyribonuclease VII large subunit